MRIVTVSLKYLFPGCRVSEMGRLFRVWAGSSLALVAIALLDLHIGSPVGLPLLIGSFGASAVLVFGAPSSPLARARNVLGGHVLSALTGVTFAICLGDMPWLASGFAVGTAILLMSVTGTLHPPGGATALIAVTGGESIRQLGFLYVLVPCLTGALLLLGFSAILSLLEKRAGLAAICHVWNRCPLGHSVDSKGDPLSREWGESMERDAGGNDCPLKTAALSEEKGRQPF